MRTSFYYTLLLFSLVGLSSCENDIELKSDETELLIGHWIGPVYIDTLVQNTRAHAFYENDYGISFNPENLLIKRQNAV